jgi:DNA gyrase subunit A
MKIIPAPDFPTGGMIMDTKGAEELYKTGNGRIVMRAKCHTEVITASSKGGGRTKTAIVITELPYMTNKAALLEKIADMVNEKKLDGIADLRDESDRDGIRVVVELKRDAVPALVQNNLFKKTALQASFSGNMLALVDDGKQPQRITLREALSIFIEYRYSRRYRGEFLLWCKF